LKKHLKVDPGAEHGAGGDKITLVNIYSQFSMPADIFVHKIERILEGFYRGNVMILGDISTK